MRQTPAPGEKFIMVDIDALHTEAGLLRALEEAKGHHMSADELQEQRVSFIYGAMSSESCVTREQIRDVLEKKAGA